MEQQDRETILYHERRFDSATFHKVAQRCYCNKKKQINNLFRLNTL